MLLNVSERLELQTTAVDAWRLLRDTERLARLVPGVDSVIRTEDLEREAYRVQVTEKVGPFKVTMKLEVTPTEVVDLSAIGATVKGGDVTGLTRATGPIRIDLGALPEATSLTFTANIEVLGKLATLGAPVIRRRVAELFKEFGRRVTAELQSVQP